jgi:hypothetical protein
MRPAWRKALRGNKESVWSPGLGREASREFPWHVFANARKRSLRRAHHHATTRPGASNMTKGQHGNKEAKKPKKVHVPNPPGLPASLAPTVASTLKPKKR